CSGATAVGRQRHRGARVSCGAGRAHHPGCRRTSGVDGPRRGGPPHPPPGPGPVTTRRRRATGPGGRMTPLLVGLAVVAGGVAALRWLRVAQREHYLPGTVTRFALRWWTVTPLNVAIGIVAL